MACVRDRATINFAGFSGEILDIDIRRDSLPMNSGGGSIEFIPMDIGPSKIEMDIAQKLGGSKRISNLVGSNGEDITVKFPDQTEMSFHGFITEVEDIESPDCFSYCHCVVAPTGPIFVGDGEDEKVLTLLEMLRMINERLEEDREDDEGEDPYLLQDLKGVNEKLDEMEEGE